MCDNSWGNFHLNCSSIGRNNLVLSGPECNTTIVSSNTDVVSVACLRFEAQYASQICAISLA